MALSYNGLSGPVRGIENEETGINCESFTVRYFPEVKEYLPGITGESAQRAVSSKLSRDISIAGEVKGATGIMAITVATAATVANDVGDFGDGTGAIFFSEATDAQGRSAWRTVSMQLESRPLIAA